MILPFVTYLLTAVTKLWLSDRKKISLRTSSAVTISNASPPLTVNEVDLELNSSRVSTLILVLSVLPDL